MIADAFFGVVAAVAVATTPAAPVAPDAPDALIPVEVVLTAYTCQDHPNNPMTNAPGMCEVTASGGDPHTEGIACPRDMMGQAVYLPDYGWRVCDDRGAYDVIAGKPHFDLRVSTYADALRVGSGAYTLYVPSEE